MDSLVRIWYNFFVNHFLFPLWKFWYLFLILWKFTMMCLYFSFILLSTLRTFSIWGLRTIFSSEIFIFIISCLFLLILSVIYLWYFFQGGYWNSWICLPCLLLFLLHFFSLCLLHCVLGEFLSSVSQYTDWL